MVETLSGLRAKPALLHRLETKLPHETAPDEFCHSGSLDAVTSTGAEERNK